jgi:hypothetical protein
MGIARQRLIKSPVTNLNDFSEPFGGITREVRLWASLCKPSSYYVLVLLEKKKNRNFRAVFNESLFISNFKKICLAV